MARMLSGDRPGVILASDKCLEWGFSIEALRKLANDPKNLIILTEKSASLSDASADRVGVSQSLWNIWNEGAQQAGSVVRPDGSMLADRGVQATRLEGDETLLYQQSLARRRQMHSTQQGDNTADDPAADIADDDSTTTSESSNESEVEHQGRALNVTASMMQTKRKVDVTDAELGVNILLRRKTVYDYDVRGRKGREKMFPFATKRGRNDEFGDLIRPEDYLRAEERDEVDGHDMREEAKGEATVGQKRKWAEVAPQNARSFQRGSKRQKVDLEDRLNRNGANDDAEDEAASESEESDYEPEETASEGPSKAVFIEQKLEVRLGIAYVDFSALHEKRDLEMLIPLIRPRKLIFTAGQAAETLAIAEDFKALLETEEARTNVFAPLTGESVDASVDTNAWTLKLSRDLVKTLTWQKIKEGMGVVAVTGRLATILSQAGENAAAEENRRKKLKMIQGGDEATDMEMADAGKQIEDGDPVLDVLNSPSTNSQYIIRPIHVGDLRLADLRRFMLGSGHHAEFRGEGTLLVDDAVVVRKSANGRIEVESAGYATSYGQQTDSTFFAVRREIYRGLAVVAGG